MVRLPQATLPMLWLSWTGDTHFPMDCLARSYRAAPGPRQVTLVPNMRHSHQAGWVRPESYAFADSVVNSGEGWMTQKSLERVDRKWKATFVSNQPIDEVALYTTTEQGEGPDRNWTTTQVSWSQQGQQVVSEGMLPPGTQAWFISLKSNDLYASSDYQTTQP
jgi:hypothetical protein